MYTQHMLNVDRRTFLVYTIQSMLRAISRKYSDFAQDHHSLKAYYIEGKMVLI